MDKHTLQIVTRHGPVASLLLPESAAKQVLDNWQSRAYKLRGQEMIVGTDLNGCAYAVEVESIVALFCVRAPDSGPAPGSTFNRSGRN